MADQIYNFPRLYTPQDLKNGVALNLSEDQSHYLRNVLRKTVGDKVRLFNEASGEWVSSISTESKKFIGLTIAEQIRVPESSTAELHLIYSPIKKDRNDMLIEKAVELGATHIHPVLFSRTIVRDIKIERIEAQMMEAAEQCERLSIPKLSPLKDFKKFLSEWDKNIPLYAGIERTDATPLSSITPPSSSALLIGPEGGISADEIALLSTRSFATPVSLGPRILRAETASFYGLSILSSKIDAA